MVSIEKTVKKVDSLAAFIRLAEQYDALRTQLEPVVAHCWDHSEGVVALSKSFGFVLRAITVNGVFISESEARALTTEWYLKKKKAGDLVMEVYLKLADEEAFYEKTNRLVLKDICVELKYHIDENPSICDRAEIVLHKGYCPPAVFVNELEKLPVVVKTVNLNSRNMMSGAARDVLIHEALKEAKDRQVRLRLHESFLDAYPRYKDKVDENGFYKGDIPVC